MHVFMCIYYLDSEKLSFWRNFVCILYRHILCENLLKRSYLLKVLMLKLHLLKIICPSANKDSMSLASCFYANLGLQCYFLSKQ